MEHSARYVQLSARLKTLEVALLPPLNPTGEYSDFDRIGTAAYRVLVHAEIESYLEDRALEIAHHAHRAWKLGVVTRPLLALLAFSGHEMALPPRTLSPPQPTQAKTWSDHIEVDNKVQCALTTYNHEVRVNNHGIREANLLRLLLPIGISPAKLDPMLLVQLDSYGAKRGEVAHSSLTSVKQALDPQTEVSDVQQLLAEIDKLDDELSNLMSP